MTMTMSCLKLCSRYQAIDTSAPDLTIADSPPERPGSSSAVETGRQPSTADNREIDEVVQEICDIGTCQAGGLHDDDEDGPGKV
jgi:hypothetical protein